jgi:hypothetical protein
MHFGNSGPSVIKKKHTTIDFHRKFLKMKNKLFKFLNTYREFEHHSRKPALVKVTGV